MRRYALPPLLGFLSWIHSACAFMHSIMMLTHYPMVFLAVPEEIALCQWTDWTSCDFFCGTTRVSQKTREKASEGSDGDCRKDLDTSENISKDVEKEDCDGDQQCTSEY